jgi:hydrogenase expression/formation protein HypC
MCLGMPCELVQLGSDGSAVVLDGCRTLTVSLLTLGDPVAPGDWVLVHAGFALARLTPEQALEARALRSTPGEVRT